MAVKKWIFDLNILKKSRIPRMELVQGDTDANVFQIHLKTLERYTEVPLDLTDSYVTVTVKKADDTIVVGEAQIIDSTNGIIEYTCRGNELSYPGLVIATIEVYDTTHIKRFTTTQFKFYVVEQLDDGSGIPSTTEYTVLTDLIAQTQSVVTNENERIENENTRIANENIRQENESIRQNNEQTRVTAENNRVNAESIREANENERINNENIRQANEETRNTSEANRERAESLRQMAEQERINAENARVAAENARNVAELARKNAENIRQSNESARISEENTRILQENARVQVENERIANENIRDANEAVRQNNESVRITAEGNRVQAEAIREANEAERISNENTRIANENTRQSNEAIRQNNESIRQSNEATRINNENIRQQQEQARQASMADIENRWNTLTTAQQQDAEVINARTSTVKNKTFPALTNRIEELEQDTITPVYNETITIDGGIGSIPSNAAEGQISVTVRGRTLKQELVYDYGTMAEWEVPHSTTQKVAGGFIGTHNGTNNVSVLLSFPQVKPATKYGLLLCVSKNTSNAPFLFDPNAFLQSRTGIDLGNTVGNKKLVFTTKENISSKNFQLLQFSQSSGEIAFQDIRLFELPAGSEIENDFNTLSADELAQKYPYISGGSAKSTLSAMRVKAVGKNLLKDGEFYDSGYSWDQGFLYRRKSRIVENTTKILRVNQLENYTGAGQVVRVKKGENLTLSAIKRSNNEVRLRITEVGTIQEAFAVPTSIGQRRNVARLLSSVGVRRSVTLTSVTTDYVVVTVDGPSISSPETLEVEDLMLEYGATATVYEPYKESNAYVIAKDEEGNILELRSLPNGVKDEISVSEGKLIKRVSDELVIPTTGWELYNAGKSNTISFRVRTGATNIATVRDIEIPNIRTTLPFPVVSTYAIANIDEEGINFARSHVYPDYVYISILRNRLTTQDVAGFQQWLQSNYPAATLNYQLANPIITQLPAQTLIGYPNGTIYWEPVVKDTAIYNNGVSIADTTLPIKTLLKVIKYVPETKTAIDITSTCTISPDKLSFTSTALTNGDTVIYEYEYDQSLTTIPTLEVTANMNLKAVVNGTSKAVANLNKYVLDLNDFTIATLLNHEMRLTLLEVQ